VLPWFLSHEHNAIQHITGWADGRNLLTAAVWAVLLASAAHIIVTLASATLPSRSQAMCVEPEPEHDGDHKTTSAAVAVDAEQEWRCWMQEHCTRLLVGFSVALVAYYPSSHISQYVAFILAERTLYLPSVGAALVIAEAAVAAASWPKASGGPSASSPAIADVRTTVAGVPAASTDERAGRDGGDVMTPATPEPTKQRTPVNNRKARRSVPPSRALPPAEVPRDVTVSAPAAAPAPAHDSPVRPEAACNTAAVGESGRVRAWASLAVLAGLCGVWCFRTVTRNQDWLTEDALMASNLALYPVGNTMTIYGMG